MIGYLFEGMRYIELNPVRANMIAHPGEFSWSSYAANARGIGDALVSPHLLYRRLGRDEDERQQNYRELVQAPLDAQIVTTMRDSTNKGWAMEVAASKRRLKR